VISPPIPFWGAFEDQQGTFWFGDIAGQLWFGDPLGELRQTYTSSTTSEIVRVGGYVQAGQFELLAISKDRVLQRFDGRGWDVLFTQNDLSNDQDGELVFLRPGRAVATLPDGDGMIQYDSSSIIPVQLEEWDPARRGHLIALEQIEPLGLFIGTRTGRMFLRATEDGLLEELEDLVPIEDRSAVYDIVPFRGGFIEAGRRGFIRQWHPASGFCDQINVDFQVDLHRIASLGDVFIAAGVTRDQVNKGFVIRVQP
jgi:hypothetical protein